MKMIWHHTLLLALSLLISIDCLAQHDGGSALVFSSSTIDFGTIREVDGPQSRGFSAINMGDATIIVKEIVTTCGCTTVRYDDNTITPGESFSFDVVYDPTNRPGRFERSIMITTSETDMPITLKICGRVEPRDKSLTELYPFDFGGGLRLHSNFHAFGYVEHGKEVEESIAYINMSTANISLDIEYDSTSGLLNIDAPTSIAPGAKGDIILRYSVDAESKVYGIKRDVMTISVDGIKASYPLTTQVIVVDNFDSTDDISSPKLAISKNIIKFGEVNCTNDVVCASIALSNKGSSPLYVRAIESSSPAVTAVWESAKVIAPGHSRDIVVRLHCSLIEDVDNPLVVRLSIISNDPQRPMQSVKVTAIPR